MFLNVGFRSERESNFLENRLSPYVLVLGWKKDEMYRKKERVLRTLPVVSGCFDDVEDVYVSVAVYVAVSIVLRLAFL